MRAVSAGAEFVIAPELFLCGYPPRDLLLRPDFIEANFTALQQTAASIGAVLCVGFVDKNSARPGARFATQLPFCKMARSSGARTNLCCRRAMSLMRDRYFEPAKSVVPFEFNGRKLGITVCEDIWNDEDFWPDRLYRRDPVKELIAQGADLILNISASPWCVGKELTRLAMLQRVARDERVPLVQVNAIGANDELIFDGHSVALDRQRQSARARERLR